MRENPVYSPVTVITDNWFTYGVSYGELIKATIYSRKSSVIDFFKTRCLLEVHLFLPRDEKNIACQVEIC